MNKKIQKGLQPPSSKKKKKRLISGFLEAEEEKDVSLPKKKVFQKFLSTFLKIALFPWNTF